MENYYYDTRRHRLFVRSLYSYVYLMPLMMMLTYYYCYVRRVCISIRQRSDRTQIHIVYGMPQPHLCDWDERPHLITTKMKFIRPRIMSMPSHPHHSSVVTSTWWKLFGEKVLAKVQTRWKTFYTHHHHSGILDGGIATHCPIQQHNRCMLT